MRFDAKLQMLLELGLSGYCVPKIMILVLVSSNYTILTGDTFF